MKTVLMTTVLMMVTFCIMSAQKNQSANCAGIPTFYLDSQFEIVESSDEAKYYANAVFSTQNSIFIEAFRIKSKTICFEGEFSDLGLQTQNGVFRYYFPNGKVESQGCYQMGVKIGVWKRYNLNGTEKSDLYYSPERYELLSQLTEDQKN